MPTLFAQADDQFALILCGIAVALSAVVMYLTPVVSRMTGQIRLHQPDQTAEWSAGQISSLMDEPTPVPQEKAA